VLSSTRLVDTDITLRPFQVKDSAQLYEAVCKSLSELKPWMSWTTENYTEHTAKEFIAITQARWEERTLFAFASTRDDEILGSCSLSGINPIYHFCNVGYWVRTGERGQGIAGRAARLAARFGFEQVGLIRARS
jgi:RimJ/RimL family protein N-acetyltransferase